ncbi:hypothetical protein LCI18_002834 [Fusarium solani-melongenae]|uniref:Uncharacterized protein n=1 Tax=Fusarium solani subsp. cucurbitae TaxID=2747967 RepID=A0ACD3YSI7_FUSSC|nr:hypothetical protein LCI18_002834 [Fusarium solani-melongenae]
MKQVARTKAGPGSRLVEEVVGCMFQPCPSRANSPPGCRSVNCNGDGAPHALSKPGKQYLPFFWALAFRCDPSVLNPLTAEQLDSRADEFVRAIDLVAVRALASSYNHGSPCRIDEMEIARGSFNVCFFAKFDDRTWVIRIPIITVIHDAWGKLRSEVCTMRYIQENIQIPIPRVHSCASKWRRRFLAQGRDPWLTERHRLLHGIDLTAHLVPYVMDHRLDAEPDKPGSVIGEVKDEADIEAALISASNTTRQAAGILGGQGTNGIGIDGLDEFPSLQFALLVCERPKVGWRRRAASEDVAKT